MYCHDFAIRRIHKSISLLIHWWILVSSCRSCSLGTWIERLDATLVGEMVEVREIFTFCFDLLFLEVVEQILGDDARLIGVELNEVLDAVVDYFVHLEQEVCLVSEQLSSHILILICVHNIAIRHRCQYRFDEILKPLVYQMLLFLFKFSAPLFFAEVFFEVLLDLSADKGLGLEDALVDGVEEDQEHEGVGRPVIKFILLFLWLISFSCIHWYKNATFNIFFHFATAFGFQLFE
jgi:hypothetical protein